MSYYLAPNAKGKRIEEIINCVLCDHSHYTSLTNIRPCTHKITPKKCLIIKQAGFLCYLNQIK